ncbi:cation diffusion facilitator family transporter [Candidatus Entotheonella palauensis]|uniref:Cation transporter n=1 Tax=Candidatus Entotheonella gemina TaxID=1429439 RepID=W4MBL8_9BACT|nr:cation diffusion facilitator family transporter [Candidatus Entotheonella palauensis]ETX07042.1 MAG: cation transporter [Candidatus Entotheonella gemina]
MGLPQVDLEPTHRDRLVRKLILLEGCANVVVLLAKVVVGLSTGSFAVLSDAIHSLTDVANNVVALVVVRVAGAPPDREHPYGHRKFETLAVFGLATLLTVLAIELALRAMERGEHQVIQHGWGLAVMLGVLVVNVSIALWQGYWARRLNSDLLRADARHTMADSLTTVVVIAGWQLAAMGYLWLDALFALSVAGLVLWLAYGLFRRAIPVLVDGMAAAPEALSEAVRSVPGVRQVRRIRSRWIGATPSVDVVIAVDPHLSTVEAHAIADAIEALLQKQYAVEDSTIHIEPD